MTLLYGLMASSGRVMEKPVLQEQQALKCPRCDSSNTKFCYYNNYSLSQPRHFCKACKRYWTRGGTLRNVPVGGGYRKNKKVKKSGGGVGGGGGGGSGSDTTHIPLSQQIHASTSTSHINQLLYGLPNSSSFSNFPFQRFNSRNSGGEEGIPQSYNGYNHQSQLSGLGLSFPSSSSSMNREEHDYGAGFTHVQDLSLLGTSNYASYATNASLIASSLQKQKQVWNGMKETNFQSLLPFQNLQMGSNGEASMVMDLVKSEEGKDNRPTHRMEWRVPSETQVEPLGSLDSSLYNWNSPSVATWPDLANYGPSITPLI